MTASRTQNQRRWRGVVLVALFWLIGGTVVNVAVAWTCYLLHDPQMFARRSPVDPEQVLAWTHFPGNIRTMVHVSSDTTHGCWGGSARYASILMRDVEAHGYRCGFPLKSLHWWEWFDAGQPSDAEYRSHGLFYVPWSLPPKPHAMTGQTGKSAIPIAPLWFGFVFNNLFYTTLLWLPSRGPFVLRRWRRRRQGLCLVCGYDLRGSLTSTSSGVCPECGKVAVRSVKDAG